MLKRILAAVTIIVIGVAGYGFYLLWSTNYFKNLNPHFSGKSTAVHGLIGPEDITIHPKTGIAYISSSDWRASSKGGDSRGAIYAYDLKSAKPELINLTPEAAGDFHPHGISLYVGEDNKSTLFVINHAGGKHSIEIYDCNSFTLTHRKTLSDPMLVSPNDLVAVGPETVYVTNDHGYPAGPMQILEDYLMLRKANVVYFNEIKWTQAAAAIRYANGINVSHDGKTLYLCGTTEEALYIYDRDPISGKLELNDKINLDTGVDNIELDANGDLWIGAHPKLLAFLAHAKDASKLSPSQVLHLTQDGRGGFTVQEVYLNLGQEISGASVAAVYDGRMLIGAVFDPKFLDCRLP